MVTPRFSFPTPTPVTLPAFLPAPVGIMCLLTPAQLAVTQQVYQLAMERTRAVLAPSKVEKLYARSAN